MKPISPIFILTIIFVTITINSIKIKSNNHHQQHHCLSNQNQKQYKLISIADDDLPTGIKFWINKTRIGLQGCNKVTCNFYKNQNQFQLFQEACFRTKRQCQKDYDDSYLNILQRASAAVQSEDKLQLYFYVDDNQLDPILVLQLLQPNC